jgi:hypothetical protein
MRSCPSEVLHAYSATSRLGLYAEMLLSRDRGFGAERGGAALQRQAMPLCRDV